MLQQMRIYSPPENHQLAKILFTAKLTKTAVAHEPVPYGYKHKHFQEHHALFTIPALEAGENQYVFGTHSILRKLAPKDASLTPFEQASVDQWLEVIERQLQPAVGVLILNANELTQIKEEQKVKARDVILKVSKKLEQRLKLSAFLVGDNLTIADISAYYSWNQVRSLMQQQLKNLTCVHRWARYIASIPLH